MSDAKTSSSKRTSDKNDGPKPVVIAHRPILKDPDAKVADSDAEPVSEAKMPSSSMNTLKPTGNVTGPEEEEKKDDDKDQANADKSDSQSAESIPVPELSSVGEDDQLAEKEDKRPDTSSDDDPLDSEASDEDKTKSKSAEEVDAAEAEKQAAHDTEIQKLVDEKKYFLPINTIEKRKTKRFVLLGIILSLILALAWVDIALDAGLIQLGGIKPVTHFSLTSVK